LQRYTIVNNLPFYESYRVYDILFDYIISSFSWNEKEKAFKLCDKLNELNKI